MDFFGDIKMESKNKYLKLGKRFQELRNIAIKYNVIIITATQTEKKK
jgi:hypothetical protein